MANGIRTCDPRGFNKGRSSTFREGSQGYENNNKDEDNSPKTLNDKNYQAPSQKFRQLIWIQVHIQNNRRDINSLLGSLTKESLTGRCKNPTWFMAK